MKNQREVSYTEFEYNEKPYTLKESGTLKEPVPLNSATLNRKIVTLKFPEF